MRTFLILFLLSIGLQAQTWGEQRILFGRTFTSTDNLELKVDGMTDTLMADTLWSNILPITKSSGVYGISAYLDSSSLTRTLDTVDVILDVQLLAIFAPKPQQTNFFSTYTPRAKVIARSPWKHLITFAECDTLYTLSIAQSDSSWWSPNYNFLQYRLRETTADTTFHNVMEFRDLEDTIK